MKIYLSEHIAQSARERLEERFEIVDNFEHPEELDGIIVRRARVTRDIIERAGKLKVICMHGVGLDTIDMEAAKEYGIPVTRVPGGSIESVAELAVTFMLALGRKLKYIDQGMRQGAFDHFGMEEMVGNEVYGKKVGLVGCGHIGRRVGEIMRNAFSAEIYCYAPSKTVEECREMGYQKVDTIKELFRIVDYANISIPLLEETRNIINAETFEGANPGLIMVNTSRGGIVDEDALYHALLEGKIKGAASDVFAKEPPEKDSPLLHLQNFIATLHVGGSTEEALERVGNCTVDNLLRELDNCQAARE